jgi:2-oxoglutarate/2-oxoacid ferredoxin oxidoreductase subunit beta
MKYTRPEALQETDMHYCPGCGHGIAHRIICETIDELGIRERTLGVAPVGCAVLAYYYWNLDVTEAAHGRAPAVATGIRRCHPDKVVFTYQGDGDLAAIGAGEIVNAANRGERISVFFVNNAIYGMTGGQMAPTTGIGQKTTTSPHGRDTHEQGWPMKIVEMLSQLEGTVYAARCALNTPKNIRAAKKAVKIAFETQLAGRGFSIVELLSMCPVGWGISPHDATLYVEEKMIPQYSLGTFKDTAKNSV